MTSSRYFVNVPQPEYYVGFDIGQVRDPSAIAVLERSEVVVERSLVNYAYQTVTRLSIRHLERFPLGQDYPDMVEQVRRIVSRPELCRSTLIADATGVGRPVVDLLRRAGLPCRIMPVTITGGGKETYENGNWRVPKRDLITGLLVLLQRGAIQICGHLAEAQTLIDELGSMRLKVSAEGHETYAAGRENEHDDLVLAAALACWRGSLPVESMHEPRRLL